MRSKVRRSQTTQPKQLKVKSVAIVDDSTAYGQGLANEFEKTGEVARPERDLA